MRLAAVLLALAAPSAPEAAPELARSGLVAPAEWGSFSERKGSESEAAGRVSGFLSGRNGDELLELEWTRGIPVERGRELLRKELVGLEALYSGTMDPYLQALSTRTGCPGKFRLRREDGNGKNALRREYSLFASGTRALGACSRETARYQVRLLLIVCESSGSFVVLRRFRGISSREKPRGFGEWKCEERASAVVAP